MLRTVLIYGVITGIVVGLPMSYLALGLSGPAAHSYTVGYLVMLIALSVIFVGIKAHRDRALGGVIRFWPALALGLGITVVAGVIYAATWDLAQQLAHVDFAGDYAKSVIAHQKAHGASAETLARVTAEMERFKASYANPLYRYFMTFIELFPVGVLVSLVSAGLLRNSRFLAARG